MNKGARTTTRSLEQGNGVSSCKPGLWLWHAVLLLGLLIVGYRFINHPAIKREITEIRPMPAPRSLRVPKVALLFLTRGPMPHESMWALWLEAAAGALPQELAYMICRQEPSVWRTLEHTCGVLAAAPSVLNRQALFSVYVHASPNFEGGQLLCDEYECWIGFRL